MKAKLISIISISLFLTLHALGQDGRPVNNFFKAPGSPVNPKVKVSWNRYHTNDGLHEIYTQLVAAYPNLVTLESIGKSWEGKDLWLLTVTNHRNMSHKQKPAFWIDGNIHANEIQTAEASAYTAWYLAETYGKNNFITELLDQKVFYIMPVMNPDGRDHYMTKPNSFNSPRSGTMPLDDDGDGLVGEDGYNDLNGDGHITMMRRKNPYGGWRTDPDFPDRMERAKPGEFGEWELLGWESMDSDGDGEVGEDPEVGYYDHNRDWGWNWQPDYVQRGAYLYPFSHPESRAVRDFVLAHPNIAGSHTHHNSGGMLLRGPGSKDDERYYMREDVQVYDALGAVGEKMIPGYDYLITHSDLYTVYGGQVDWFHIMRGIFTFTTEMFGRYYLFNEKPERGGWGFADDYFFFDQKLLFGDAWVPWQDVDHPQLGKIQVGGFKKNFIRINPGFMLEQEVHRLMAFSLFHAYHTPQLEFVELSQTDLGGGLSEVIAVVVNTRLIPTHAGVDRQHKIERPNIISLDGANVLAGMLVDQRDLNHVREQKQNPAKLRVENIPGMGTVTVKWIVEGGRNITVTVDSSKGGFVSKSL